MTVASLRRLPGFRFEDRTPLRESLPRMDVALFAGFAARGPVGLAVPIEDVSQFETVFGGDVVLAFDPRRGQVVRAQLPPAVRMFFANGGRRCWVVRLATQPRSNAFRLPGLLAPFALEARSPGSWSDTVKVSASLTRDQRHAESWDGVASVLEISDTRTATLVAGDLLRLTWRDAQIEGYAGVLRTTAIPNADRGRPRLRVELGEIQWFDVARPMAAAGVAHLSSGASVPAYIDGQTLSLDADATLAPRPGAVVRATCGADELFVAVDHVTVIPPSGSPSGMPVRLGGRVVWRRAGPPSSRDIPEVERLGLDVWATENGGPAQRLGELGLAPGHPRHLGTLPRDAAVYGNLDELVDSPWADAITPRFPLAGPGTAELCVPLGVTALPVHWMDAELASGAPLVRDGLSRFDASLFIDEELADSRVATLQDDVDFLRYMAASTREPRGIHVALTVDEPSLIAVPDAAQSGWLNSGEGRPLPPDASASPTPVLCPKDDFIDCGAVLAAAPVLTSRKDGDTGRISLAWLAEPGISRFLLEESTSRDWRGSVVVFEGDAREFTQPARRPGDYYYRVRGTGDHPTEWSNGASERIAPAGFDVANPAEYADDVLLAVHRALLRICAARRDALAVLSLPEHYDDQAVLEHVRRLRPIAVGQSAIDDASLRGIVPPFSAGEEGALGFGALYDTWSSARGAQGEISAVAPDGSVCGVIARRTNARGAWISPANEPLHGVVALLKPMSRDRRGALQRSQVNVSVPTGTGFLLFSADTLSPDDDLRPIGVRRLLILLNRLVMRHGSTYVFEPNDDAFRRRVQRGFDALLGDLFARGAFAGSTVETAFRVVTSESINTPQSVDQGRFIVELRVAPARPLSFVTIRLVQAGERVMVTGG